MIETNPFRYFLPEHPKKLILGSFPCFNGADYGDWFYSGSGKNHFWPLLSDLVNMPAGNRDEKMALCQKHHIALTDVAWRIERKRHNCSDANLKIIEYNTRGIDTCLGAGVQQIFFTSRFVETQFRRLYPNHHLPAALLLSPSPAANMHIGGLAKYKTMLLAGLVKSPYQYRLLCYRRLLME